MNVSNLKKFFKLSDNDLLTLEDEFNELESSNNELYIYLTVIKKIINHFPKPYTTSSSGSSIVFLSNESNVVFQFFKLENAFNNTFNAYEKIYKYPNPIKLTIEDDNYKNVIYEYDIKECITPVIGTYKSTTDYAIPIRLFIWEKIKTYPKSKNIQKFLKNNLNKFLWDISKCINGLKIVGVCQNDCTIDNTAIYNNKFIIYDFDASKIDTKHILSNVDEKTMLQSLKSININANLNIDDILYRIIYVEGKNTYNSKNIIDKIIDLDKTTIVYS